MPFYNREKDIRRMKAVLSGDPNLLYFVYGPINSGKTALLMKVLEELPEEYRVFYINFRGLEGGYSKIMRAFFRLGDENLWKKIRERAPIVAGAIEYVEKIAKKFNTKIELPGEIIRLLQVGGEDPEKIDVFDYLEGIMRNFKEKGKKSILVIDELQVIRDELNATGRPVLGRLFNFLVRMTKETHLCHSLCSTSDCLFIEDIYSNARLEGRAKYILVDDLSRDEAYKLYEGFGFEDEELVWDWIGGKVGDMVRLYEEKKQGYSEEEGLRNMLKDEVGRLKDLLESVEEGERGEIDIDELKRALKFFKRNEICDVGEVKRGLRRFLIQENILFYNPVEGTIRPQGRLLLRAIREVIGG